MFLFCIVYAMVLSLIISVLPSLWKKTGTGILILLTSFPFIIEYFIYYQFKIMYDLNTILTSAADVASNYSKEILVMIFSPQGILTIALFLLPSILYIILVRFLEFDINSWIERCTVLILLILFLSVNSLGISSNSTLNSIWNQRYHFQTATHQFGLLTGLNLEIHELCMKDSSSINFEVVAPEVTDIPTPPVEEVIPVEYGLNQIDIDFKSLEASGIYAQINSYISSLSASSKNEYTGLFKDKNLIFITAEAFALEVIDPEITPTLYRLATKGIQFTDYYQMSGAGTTGGEYQNIFGMIPTWGGSSFIATSVSYNPYTMGSMLNELGYYGQAFHNNDYTYYSRHETHNNIGYSEGFMGYGNGMEQYVSDLWPQSDLEMFEGTIPLYIDKQPFNVYYMTVSGHSLYTQNNNDMTKKNWDKVADLTYSDQIKGYLAAQLELENALSYLMAQLESYDILNDTVICLTSDHFPYGLDTSRSLGNIPYLSELYGYNVETIFERDHSAWILWCGSLENEEAIIIDSPTCSLDILPTLANLFGIEFDSRLLVGRDVFADTTPLVFNISYDWLSEYGTYEAASDTFTPFDSDVILPEDYVEKTTLIVQNKISYCDAVLRNDYYRYLLGNN